MTVITVENEMAMLRLGEQFAVNLKSGDWIAIDGPLGAGKTVFAKGVLRGLGYTGDVASPTYALVQYYDLPDVRIPVVHADLYRLETAAALEEVGLLDSADHCITLVEWAARAGKGYGNPNIEIVIEPLDNEVRHVTINTAGLA